MDDSQLQIKEHPRWSLQDYLSLGYLFLLVIGIAFDSIYYGILGINIIKYSTILDILLSPVAFLTSSIVIPIILGCGLIIPWVVHRWTVYYHEKNRVKDWYQAKYNVQNLDEKFNNDSLDSKIPMFVIFLLSVFITYSVLEGNSDKNTIKAKKIEIDNRITFQNGDVKNVKLIGLNSQYIFYVTQNDTTITLAPIQGNITEIQKLD